MSVRFDSPAMNELELPEGPGSCGAGRCSPLRSEQLCIACRRVLALAAQISFRCYPLAIVPFPLEFPVANTVEVSWSSKNRDEQVHASKLCV